MKNTVLTTADERKLVTAVLQNDRKAILKLISLYERLVVAMVFKMIDKPPDREDICQDVFLKIFSHLKTFKFDSKLSTWIAQITYNTSVNYLQKKKTLLLDEVFTNYRTDEDEEGNYAETITANFMHQTVAMPDELLQQSETTQLEDMSYTDIAQITQLPLNTVKSYLFRARKMLKDFLQQHQFVHR